MFYEFEGRTEQEAIENAVSQLGLEKDQFDVEILEVQKSSLFKKGLVRIRVHVLKTGDSFDSMDEDANSVQNEEMLTEEMDEMYEKCKGILKDFVVELIVKLGYDVAVENITKERKNLVVRLSSSDSPIVIGKHGKNLDALQLLANTFVSNKGFPYIRVLIDCENYRVRREESLVRLAYETADKVTMYRRSILLEPMNPYERRLIHTTLNDVSDIETKSEGEGVYRRVRVSLR
ncbi:MAG: RNA-binding cell elongation regulator Jag/EloR [Treponema sp.]